MVADGCCENCRLSATTAMLSPELLSRMKSLPLPEKLLDCLTCGATVSVPGALGVTVICTLRARPAAIGDEPLLVRRTLAGVPLITCAVQPLGRLLCTTCTALDAR